MAPPCEELPLARRASTLQLQPGRDDRSHSLLPIARLRQRALTPCRGWRCRACSGSTLKPRLASHVHQVNNVTFVSSPSDSGVRMIRSVCICLSWPGSAFTPWSDSRPRETSPLRLRQRCLSAILGQVNPRDHNSSAVLQVDRKRPEERGQGPARLGTRNPAVVAPWWFALPSVPTFAICQGHESSNNGERPPLRRGAATLQLPARGLPFGPSCSHSSAARELEEPVSCCPSLRLRQSALTPSRSSWLTVLFRLYTSQGPSTPSPVGLTPPFFPHSPFCA